MAQTAALGNKLRRRLDLGVLYLSTLGRGFQARRIFDDVAAYCMFIGYPRSGHTLVGSLLDAHPEIIIGHGVDALTYLKLGFGKYQLLQLLLDNSRAAARKGRQKPGYSYVVPNQWQGTFRTLKVIGDKRGGLSTRELANNPKLLARLRRSVGVRLRFLHIIRDPYDNITTICLMRPEKDLNLRRSIEDYFGLCRKVTDIKSRLDPTEILEVRHEAFVADPRGRLAECYRFLGVDAPGDYLEDCASIVFKSPHQSRFKGEWTPELIEAVASRIESYPYLAGYSYR